MGYKKCVLAVILVLLLVAGLTGCGRQKATEEKQNTIPIIVMKPSAATSAGNSEEALLGYWDINKGEFAWGKDPVFIKGPDSGSFPRLVWDGEDKLFACSFGNETSQGLNKTKQEKMSIKDITIECNGVFVPLEGFSQDDTLLAAYPSAQAVLSQNAVASNSANDIIINRFQGNNRVKTSLPVPDYVKGELAPLLITGTVDHFKLLLFYNNNMEGKTGLVLANVSGKNTDWQQIGGADLGLIAGAGAVLAYSDNRIYISEPVMSVIDLNSHPLKIKEFTAANELKQSISKNIELAQHKYGEVYACTQLGAYQDTMLMAVDLPDEHWIWAINGTRCIGSLYINNDKKTIEACRLNASSRTISFTTRVNGIILPAQGFGQYK